MFQRTDTRPGKRSLWVLAALSALVALGGCYSNPDPTEWNANAHKNFVAACITDVASGNGSTTTSLLASTTTCECIYDLIKAPESGERGRYPIEWDALKDYEELQAAAKPGPRPPKPPANLTKAIDACAPEASNP